MNRNKKSFLNAAIAIAIALVFVMPVVAFANVDETSTVEVKRIKNAIATMDMAMLNTLEVQPRFSSPAPLDAVPVVNGAHPAVASDMLGNVVLGFESVDDPLNVFFTASIDGGRTWASNAMGWAIPEPPELPDIDSCGDGRFIGSMVPNYLQNYGGELYKVVVTDPGDISQNGYDCPYWNWYELSDPNKHFYDFKSIAVGGYTAGDPDENTWAFGGHSIVGTYEDEGTGTLLEDQPFFSYQMTPEGYAWIISWDDINGCEITSMDIDHGNLYAYPVWNFNNSETGYMDIFVDVFDFGTWDEKQGYPWHPEIGGHIIKTTGNDSFIDISVLDDNVIIVSEREGDVVAYYSPDALTTVSEVTIGTGVNPNIVHTDEDTAMCAFIKDDSVYYTVTEDGGATWSALEQVEDAVNVPEEYKASDVCGFGVAWMDDQEDTIYFAGLGGGNPILEVTDISGGLGASATFKNTGTVAATNVILSISVTGGLLGLINKTSESTIPSLDVDEESNIKTGIFFGLGMIVVEVTVVCDEGASDEETKDGKQIIIFTSIK